MEKDATAGGMRVEAEGKRKDKEKTKEDTLLASNQGPDEPVYPRPRRILFFFQPPFSPGRILPFSPFPLPLPHWPHRPLFSSPGRILAGVRGKRCPKVTAKDGPESRSPRCYAIIEGWEERRRIGESNLSSNDSPGFIRLIRRS